MKSHRILIPSSVELTHRYLSLCEAFPKLKIYYVSSSPTIIEPEKVTWSDSILISLMNESYHWQTVFKDDLNERSEGKKTHRNSIQIRKFLFNQNDWFTREEKMFFSVDVNKTRFSHLLLLFFLTLKSTQIKCISYAFPIRYGVCGEMCGDNLLALLTSESFDMAWIKDKETLMIRMRRWINVTKDFRTLVAPVHPEEVTTSTLLPFRAMMRTKDMRG